MTVHAEADLGSSMIDLRIENADAAQLYALAEMIRMNATAAFAAQMAQSHAEARPTIVPVHGRID
jgi:hypothetical protein